MSQGTTTSGVDDSAGGKTLAMPAVHAEHVGSLLRPPWLLEARERYDRCEISVDALRLTEDRAVDHVVALQHAAGCEVVTDGEMRRLSFQSALVEAVDGFGNWDLDAFLWGDWQGDRGRGLNDWHRPRPDDLGVVKKLERRSHPFAAELSYLRGRTDRIAKITIPSPSLLANFWSPERSTDAYPTLDEFLSDVAQLLAADLRELARAGARYVQLDAPHYPMMLNAQARAFYEAQGKDWRSWLARAVELDNEVMAAVPELTFGLHLCRGNQASRWLVSGSYEPIAEIVFRGTRAQRLLLEYDGPRAGDFEPLRHVPDDKHVVLGLVTSKHAKLELPQDLVDRIDAAARFVGHERLGLSPQCGFATSILGNALEEQDQCAKLRLVNDVAKRIWR